MNYTDLKHILNGLEEIDRTAFVKLSVAVSVYSNMDLSAYDEEGINILCRKIHSFWDKHYEIDIDDLTFAIQTILDHGEFKTLSDECLERALEYVELR